MTRRKAFTQVDAFTDRPFAGNPAAVCLLGATRDTEWMQQVAREMNLAETAFLVPRPDGFGLRWFTPGVEVDLCGHATLASAHVLWEEERLGSGDTARFHTRSGLLTAARSEGLIWLDFPVTPAEPVPPPAQLAETLGAVPLWAGRSPFDWLVELESAAVVRALDPDLSRLARIEARGVIVTARADDGRHDFVSRFFAPAAGVPEDPVTGSAHCALAPFWAERLGRTELAGYQASSRGGTVRTRLRGERVLLGGEAVTVARGEVLY
ncbi:MAG TPA: PhzF family phenazine biosynthesis protein [Gemmatimonadales bacterium]|nr:PhzF family phenazine biosynthesis protein [Gemmatimonadales bacterium]